MLKLIKKKLFLIKAIFWLIAIILGLLQAWSNRYSLSTGDAISYLDIGEAYFQGDWQQAVNGYFSPLYSLLLGLSVSVLNPSSYWQFFVVKLVNFTIYLLSLVAFELLLSEFINYYNIKLSNNTQKQTLIIPDWIWYVSGYILFLWSALKWIGIDNDTPDMCVATLVYLAAWLVLRVYTRSDHWLNFIGLGVVLGLGYLSKAIMFPMAFIFLGTCFFSVGNIRRSLPRISVAFLVFALISTPFIAAISQANGYLTFGTAGKFNYAWNISPGGISNHHWQGKPPGSGIPKHPIRTIFDNPIVYEFATPIGGTYPPWHNPSYWNAGLKPQFNLQKQIGEIWSHAFEYYRIFFGVLMFSYLTFVSVSGKFETSIKALIGNWRFLIPACAGLGSLLLVHVRPRLIAAFVVLLFAGFFASIRLPNSPESKRLIVGMTVGLLFFAGSQFTTISQNAGEPIHWKIANDLNQIGLNPEEKVAILGRYGVGHAYYWARLAQVKIIAEIPSLQQFWQSDDSTRSQVYKTLEEAGARVLVEEPGVNSPLDYRSLQGWQKLKNSDCYIYFLSSEDSDRRDWE
ncbi:MAG: glycosyltransferase family 39 protein [Coleofasciculus sp. D1-CHI-01]|uniref:glycosyltransferase family 39 protein n=1 Tax=Coleofasciculus sp. D1-CHI-01 TaxID=3068482 RepID=UPI003303224D